MVLLVKGLAGVLSSFKEGAKPILPLLILIVYTIVGAVIFMLLEKPNEVYELQKLKDERDEYRQELAYSMNRIKGYGNIYPVTRWGRIMTILYAFIGIPLALLALIALGGLFARICKRLWSCILSTTHCLSKDMARKFSKLGPEDDEKDGGSDDLLRFPVSMLIFITLAWVFFCAWLFTLWETEWDYWTSLYFTLISFTTIGFGDVVPGHPKFMMLIGVLLLIGLALVSTMLNIIQQQIEALAKGVKGSIDNQYQATQVEDGGEDGAGPAGMEQDSGKSIHKMVHNMPVRQRLLFKMMPTSKKQNLTKYYNKKSSMAIKACQTDDYLMQSLVGDTEMIRSIDDVNSLVALCDFGPFKKP